MIEQIIGFLKSDDMDMVRLGATLLESQIPKIQWYKILTECSRDIVEEERLAKWEIEHAAKKERGEFTWPLPMSVTPKWGFEIVKGQRKIIIKDKDILGQGLYTQLPKSRQTGQIYKIRTGHGGMKMLEKAFKLTPITSVPTISKHLIKNKIKHK